MTDLMSFLSDPTGPAVGSVDADDASVGALRYRLPRAGFVVREVRGRKMATVPAVLDEFAAAWQFPYYFGENRDAFDECLRDLDEFVGVSAGYLTVVRDAQALLADSADELNWFLETMRFAAERWAARPDPVAVRVLLQHGATAPQVTL